ncbi:MAG: glucokinase [Burkholderiaceae bacterium]
MSTDRLLADIGGTHARFALQGGAGAPLADLRVLPTAAHAGIEAAIDAYLRDVQRPVPAHCAIAIATAITGDEVAMTNHPWRFSIRALQQRFGFAQLRVINDFTALALALPLLSRDVLRQIGGGAPVAERAIALIGPGTGLGVSGLVPVAGADGRTAWAPLQGEGGHVTLAAHDEREDAVIALLRKRFGHASAERALSGPGLVNLHAAVVALAHGSALQAELPAPEITRRAVAGDAQCRRAIELFSALLGTVAGNLALTLGALGGVYIGGGIVLRLGDAFDRTLFRRRFEAKGRFAPYLAAIPVYVIDADASPALIGAGRALES